MRILRLSSESLVEYRELMLHAYADAPEAFTSTVEERQSLPLEWWSTRVSAEPEAAERVYGAFVDGARSSPELVGVAGLRFAQRPKTRHQAKLYGMYVLGEHRGKGLGRALVQAVLEGARAVPGIRMVKLTVTESNSGARALYEACGFRSFGVEPMAVRVDDRYLAKVHMWCPLEPSSAALDR